MKTGNKKFTGAMPFMENMKNYSATLNREDFKSLKKNIDNVGRHNQKLIGLLFL